MIAPAASTNPRKGRHPSWAIHARLQVCDVSSGTIRRAFTADLLGISPVSSLTKLSSASIQQVRQVLDVLDDAAIKRSVKTFLAIKKLEFHAANPDADDSFFTSWLETQVQQ
jgi:hypothetical protein